MSPADNDNERIKPVMSAAQSSLATEDDLHPAMAEKRRIRYFDEESGYQGDAQAGNGEFGYPLGRRSSTFSIHSVRSVRSGARTIDPAIALPIQYRTVSFNISHTNERVLAGVNNAKDKTTHALSDLDWHLLTTEEVARKLATSPNNGLTASEVKQKAAQYGRNVPSRPQSQVAKKIFWYFFGGFGTILCAGSILVFISWKPLGQPPALANLALAIVLAAVFLIQAVFNAWQDFSSSRVMSSITGMLPEDCHVLRDGSKQTIQAPEVVPGDVLFFKAGNKLPADIRFIEVSSDAKFDRSILTGESLPLAAVIDSTDSNYLETRCIGMQGTHCTSGSGVGIVVTTGDNTVFGHIAKLTSQPATGKTTLEKEIIRFVTIIVVLMVVMNLIVIGVWAGYIRKNHPDYMPIPLLIVNIVSVGIAFVPEGLPIALTASLTITANIMKKNNILCKSLKTVETLGAVSVLLSDKTGTLTKNQMVVTDCQIEFSSMTSDDAGKEIQRENPASNSKHSALTQLRTVSAVCNAGEFDPTTLNMPLSQRKVIGDATDQAVLRFSEMLGSVSQSRDLWRRRFELAFNSKNKFALKVVSAVNDSAAPATLSTAEADSFTMDEDMVLFIKGAPDVLITRCSQYVGEDGQVHELNEGVRVFIESIKDSWSSQGKRVLLLARKVLPANVIRSDPSYGEFETEVEEHASNGLTLVALVGIVDPPRDEVPQVVATLRRAGVRTMMVTGDFKLTAQAIARSCGIITVEDSLVHSIKSLSRQPYSESEEKAALSEQSVSAIVLSGPELITLSDAQWDRLTRYNEVVFARTTPDQKLRIVKEFKSRGNIVAMTGDGVNDAPSLKEADIGIAPGSGSDIAIEAADMVLLESFSAIVEAVLYGRVVYDNLKKTIAYLLPAGSFSEFWPVMTSVVFGLPQVLSSFLMIIICCFTDCAAATVLAFEKPEANVMLRPPRDIKKDSLVDWRLLAQSYGLIGILETVTSFAMSFWYLRRQGITFSALWFSFGNINTPANVSADDLAHALNVASAIYFVNLVVMQWFNLMAIRTRHLSIFSHPPLFNRKTQNVYLFPAILFALVVAVIFCYVGGLQGVAGSGNVPVEHWFLPMAFGLGILCVDESRKAAARRWPKGWVAWFAW